MSILGDEASGLRCSRKRLANSVFCFLIGELHDVTVVEVPTAPDDDDVPRNAVKDGGEGPAAATGIG